MNSWLLLYGGRSGEHQVSLRSAAFVNKSLLEAGFDVIPVGISLEGIWYKQDAQDRESEILELKQESSRIIRIEPGTGFLDNENNKLDIQGVFPLIHGTFGEDGLLQGLLEMVGVPYVGADVLSSALAMDKITAKILWANQELPIVPFRYVESWQWNSTDFKSINFVNESIEQLGLPLFIKPSNTGSSVGVHKAENQEEAVEAIRDALNYDTRVLIEKAIDAREVELSLIGNHGIKSFQPGEIAPTHSFYDYDAKYIDPDGARLIIPADLSEEKQREAKEIAHRAYRTLNLKGLSRVDLFLDKQSQEFYINEINTMPGFTSISMFPILCREGGMAGAELMKKLIELCFERFDERNKLKFKME